MLGTKVSAQASATITVVLAEVIEKLPFTGGQFLRLLSVALTLLLLGAFLMLTGKKRLSTRRIEK